MKTIKVLEEMQKKIEDEIESRKLSVNLGNVRITKTLETDMEILEGIENTLSEAIKNLARR
jgi:hypothetical protein